MKKVLITGASGFIGSYLKENLTSYEISTLSLHDPYWRKQSIDADVVIHCAGLAHVSSKISEEKYKEINSDMAFEVASFAKTNHVRQFIFLSTILIYGTGHIGEINYNSLTNHQSIYSKSKLNVENRLQLLNDDLFTISNIRIPLIYGANAKGNLRTILSWAHYFFMFPEMNNKRTYLSLNDLTQSISKIIEVNLSGIILIGEEKPVSTFQIIKAVRGRKNKNLFKFNFFNLLIKRIRTRNQLIGKIFGDAYYKEDYLTIAINRSILDWISTNEE